MLPAILCMFMMYWFLFQWVLHVDYD